MKKTEEDSVETRLCWSVDQGVKRFWKDTECGWLLALFNSNVETAVLLGSVLSDLENRATLI